MNIRVNEKPHNTIVFTILSFFICIIIGIVITNQIMLCINTQSKSLSVTNEVVMLEQRREELSIENEELVIANSELADRSALLSDTFLADNGYSALRDSLQFSKKMAGLTSVSGEGIIVVMSDSQSVDTLECGENNLIHSQDVQHIVDLLVGGGALAIDINGERLINTTSIMCSGPTIRINSRRYTSPFTIKAVCDPDITYDILQGDSCVIQRRTDSIRIEIEKTLDLTVASYVDQNYIFSIGNELKEKA